MQADSVLLAAIVASDEARDRAAGRRLGQLPRDPRSRGVGRDVDVDDPARRQRNDEVGEQGPEAGSLTWRESRARMSGAWLARVRPLGRGGRACRRVRWWLARAGIELQRLPACAVGTENRADGPSSPNGFLSSPALRLTS